MSNFLCFPKTDDAVHLWVLHNHVSHRLEKKSVWRSEISNLEFFLEKNLEMEGNEQNVEEEISRLCESGETTPDQEINSSENELEDEFFSVKVVRSALPLGELEPECKAMKVFVSEFNFDSKEDVIELKRKLHEY